ncbi:MAG: copper amine oxidase N-terminal domain-containing protein [Deltaproteobacteria bacterium]
MNKHIILNLIIFVVAVSVQVPVFAGVRQTEIRVKPGEKNIKINMHIVSAEKSFMKNNSLMVPLRTVSDLIGAALEKSEDQNVLIVSRNNKNIKFVLNKNVVYIDGIKKQTPCAPVLINGTTMVPLRNLAETFNAVISKDSSTGEFVITFPFTNYQNRFAYIKEGVIGDSYYGWSVLFPKGNVIDDKKPSGSSILVKNTEKGYYYYIFNTIAAADINEDGLLNELKSYVNNEKIIKEYTAVQNGRKYGAIVLESENEIYEYKAFLKDGRLYQIHLYTMDKAGFMDEEKGKVYQDIINSFSVDYSGNTKEIIDINEITNNMYSYKENSLGWEIDLPADVNLEVKKNDFSFEIINEKGKENGLTVGVDIYSANQGDTLEAYAKKEIDDTYNEVNKECISDFAAKNANISGKPAKKIYYIINTGSKSFYFFNAVIVDKKNKFHIYAYGEGKFFEGGKLDLGDRIIQSFFVPENLDKGIMSKEDGVKQYSGVINYQSTDGWRLKYPSDWTKDEKDSKFVVKNDSGLIEFQVTKEDSYCTADNIKEKYAWLKNSKVVKEETVNHKGMPVKAVCFECDIDDLKYYYNYYVFNINEQTFLAGYKISEISKSDDNLKKLNDIIQSFEFLLQRAN